MCDAEKRGIQKSDDGKLKKPWCRGKSGEASSPVGSREGLVRTRDGAPSTDPAADEEQSTRSLIYIENNTPIGSNLSR